MKKYKIAFATDQNYIEHLFVALISWLQNNSNLDFKIFVINGVIDKEIDLGLLLKALIPIQIIKGYK